jgi:surface antigen
MAIVAAARSPARGVCRFIALTVWPSPDRRLPRPGLDLSLEGGVPSRDTSAVRRLGLIALLCVAALPLAQPAGGAGTVVVYGYPLATRCPVEGIAKEIDDSGMFGCNCTSYVAWALAANGQRTDWFVRGSMDAWNWPNVARHAHIDVGSTPRVGAVAVWPKLVPPYGHLAYVTGLEPDGRFDVAEYNFEANTPAKFSFDTRTAVSPYGAVFVYVPRRTHHVS